MGMDKGPDFFQTFRWDWIATVCQIQKLCVTPTSLVLAPCRVELPFSQTFVFTM